MSPCLDDLVRDPARAAPVSCRLRSDKPYSPRSPRCSLSSRPPAWRATGSWPWRTPPISSGAPSTPFTE